MNAKEKIEELLEASEDGTITAAQVTEAGLHRSVLQEFVKSGEMYRFGRGLYEMCIRDREKGVNNMIEAIEGFRLPRYAQIPDVGLYLGHPCPGRCRFAGRKGECAQYVQGLLHRRGRLFASVEIGRAHV